MSQTKCASKGKRSNKTLTALSVAGVSLAATAASSAAVLVPATAPAMPLGEEEISGVTLATFHLLDQEKAAAKDDLLQLAGGCRGCGAADAVAVVAEAAAEVAVAVVAAAAGAVAVAAVAAAVAAGVCRGAVAGPGAKQARLFGCLIGAYRYGRAGMAGPVTMFSAGG